MEVAAKAARYEDSWVMKRNVLRHVMTMIQDREARAELTTLMDAGGDKTGRGFNSPVTTSLLCPSVYADRLNDPQTRAELVIIFTSTLFVSSQNI